MSLWPGADPRGWARLLWPGLALVPRTLTQPILPGWTVSPVLNITGLNSSAPQTEADVLQRHSYGRQLGRVSDALAALIAERGATSPPDERFDDFLAMKEDIDSLKRTAAARRVERLRADLAALKADDPAEFSRVVAELRSS